MGIQLSGWVENIVGIGEIARNKQFLIFPQCFQQLSVVYASKWISMEYRVNSFYTLYQTTKFWTWSRTGTCPKWQTDFCQHDQICFWKHGTQYGKSRKCWQVNVTTTRDCLVKGQWIGVRFCCCPSLCFYRFACKKSLVTFTHCLILPFNCLNTSQNLKMLIRIEQFLIQTTQNMHKFKILDLYYMPFDGKISEWKSVKVWILKQR